LGSEASTVLDVEPAGVAIAAGVWTDVAEAERPLADGEPEAALDLCAQQLLAGFDDEGVHKWRDELHRRLAEGLDAAAARAESASEQSAALRLTRRWAALDPLAEVPQRELIRRHAAAGDRGAALAAYERFRARLADELHIAPSTATRALVDELRGEGHAGGRPVALPHARARGAPAHEHRSGVRYARSGELSLAYQQFGQGDRDLVIVPGWASNLDAIWDIPPLGPMLAALGDSARCLVFDKRGTGLSDRTLGFGSLEQRAEDIRVVMDAADVERATVFGYSESAALALVFAASHPERVGDLVLYSSYARLLSAPDYPDGFAPELVDTFVERIGSDWGTGAVSRISFSGAPETPSAGRLLARWERSLCTPTMAAHIIRCNADIDIRPLLPSIDSRTLVLHSTGDPLCPPALGRYVADHVPQGRYLERDVNHHLPWRGDEAWFLEPIEEFLTGRPSVARAPTRVLATIVATKLLGSKGRRDRTWRTIVERHDQVVDGEVTHFGGEALTTAASGHVVIFDSPSSAVAFAAAVCEAAERLGVQAKSGVHTGEVSRRGQDISGFAVDLVHRVASVAAPGEVMVSRTVRDLAIGSTLRFVDRGRYLLEGCGEWDLFTPAPRNER
jgi:pimeloyl-ACP methyl ester carboxylesterase